ncbi:hypothetical protein MJG53_020703 [Ovis ammon polii x Ovis aries]|uniref:Uncharacterized protein n=1 Tax=Ovis ammon polii x Ovis aries TaxID=2918886 RepID=A0ACB9V420_9CETA|nr:hypothetical protein MJG53_020703 [Ovis ammon polii x Ovis aries]
MAASSSIVSVAATASSVPVLPSSCDFSNLREIKKQLLLIAGLTRERGLLHSSKWYDVAVRGDQGWILGLGGLGLIQFVNSVSFLGPLEKGQVKNEALRELRVELSKKHQARELDGFGLYLYGVVLRKLDLVKEAIDVFVEATHVLPLHWGAWLELCNLITDKEMLKFLSLPDTWMKEFFLAHIYTELQLIEEALQKYQNLIDVGFSKSSYIVSQIAVAYHNIRDIDKALSIFNELRKQDPYRIENMDTFSNLLYVRVSCFLCLGLIKLLCFESPGLDYHLVALDTRKIRDFGGMSSCLPCEMLPILVTYFNLFSCSHIFFFQSGNYYSLRSQHEKAALYFQRALKLNPRYLGAWTLMGHEYMEMKNTSAAIQAYRHAIEVNKRDYRAWYGLGQTYEILKMPFYCLYYYRRAHQLRPNDSRMLVALGECYEKLNQLVEAKKVPEIGFWRIYLAFQYDLYLKTNFFCRLHEQLTESEQAAQCYIKYIQDIYSCGEIVEHLEESTAFRYLAQYYFKCKLWDEASACAQKCCAFNDTREEGKALLRQILQLRNQGETPSTEIPAPFFLPASLSANNTPTRRVSPLNLSSVTP